MQIVKYLCTSLLAGSLLHYIPAHANTVVQFTGKLNADGKTVNYESVSYYDINSFLCGNVDYDNYRYRIVDWRFSVSPNSAETSRYLKLKRVYFRVQRAAGTGYNLYPVSDGGGALRVTQNFYYQDRIKIYFDLEFDENFLFNGGDITIPANSLLRTTASNCFYVQRDNTSLSTVNQNIFRGGPANFQMVFRSSNAVTLNFTEKTCRVGGQANQTVQLDTVLKSTLDSKRTVKGGDFTIRINCLQATVANAYVIYTDSNTPSNTSQTLSLSRASTAKGVRLQIVDNSTGQAIKFANQPSFNFIGLNDATLFTAANGTRRVIDRSYTVNYVKNGNVSAGTVNAQMIYSFYYR
ncbi:hypothetical protein CKF54_06685 [Psittacicella hinzii]|uniref:Fimbrial-type adhesion domain-containing protein n=1 Tax=Psittacicella hinzii TaxID=2028575 RepID=A0A3A1Y2A2_9GAMM|nr:fimbrial protein [Psittacicella hinzii]RIY31426.1 hypothetical protein CKF54_06685 [Psittacicella hinzii]